MSIPKTNVIALATAAVVASVCSAQLPAVSGGVSPTSTTGVAWQNDLAAARAAAKDSGKLVLVHFWSETCGPCRMLDAQVFTQPTVAGPIQQAYIPVKINATEKPELAQAYGINQVPTDVIMTPDGAVVQKLISPASPMAYVARMNGIATQYASTSGANFRKAAAESPYGQVVNNAYASLDIPQTTAPAPAAPPAAPQQVTNPYAAAPQATAPQAPAAPPAATATSRYAAATAPPVNQTANQTAAARPVTTKPAVQLPPGSPPLGFDGYCLVAMKQQRKWVRGDVRWGALHNGRTYLFANEAARDAFLADGDAYCPVLSGDDPVLAVDQGVSQQGQRQFGLEYRDAIYLFTSEETLNKFWTNPEAYARSARQSVARASAGTTVR